MHGVGIALLVDGELDRLAALHAGDGLAFLVAVRHGGDVAQVNRLSVDRGNDGAGHLLDALELIERAHQETLCALLEASAGEVHVFGAQATGHGFDRETELRQLLLIDEHLDLVLVAAAHLDRGGARHGLEIRLQTIFGEAPEKLEPLFAVDWSSAVGVNLLEQCEAHHRLGRGIEAQQQRALRFERELQQVELLAHLDARQIHVRAPDELQGHVRLTGTRYGTHLADIANDPDRLFDRSCDQVLDLQGCSPDELRAHGERRIGEIGQEIHFQARQRYKAEQRDRHHAHDDGDAPASGEVYELHGCGPVSGMRAMENAAALSAL